MYRSNVETILQQFPITTAKISTIAPFTQPPWCTAADAHLHEAIDNTQSQAHKEKESWIKQLKATANEQWTTINAEQLSSHLKRILLRRGSEHGPGLYNRLSRNTCAKVIQLRTGHCGLNAYLHRFGLADSPLCDCESGQETVEHFLLECPLYREQRIELRNAAGTGNMRVDTLLGSAEVILKCTEKFINATERFER